MKRRSVLDLLARAAPAAVVGTGAAGSAYGFGYEPSALVIERVTINVRGLPADFDSARIALLTDLHVGPFTGKAFIERAVAMANAERPDLHLLGGDYVHRSARFFRPCAEAVMKLEAPQGVYAVTGNHDYWEGVTEMEREFEGTGVTFLRNRSVALERGKGHVWLAGVDDLMTRQADPEKALLPIPRGDATILLSHNPDLAELLDPSFPVSLVLSGHTHGGQVRVPFLGSPVVPSRFGQRYVAGLARKGDTAVYTSRGIGTISPPIRINCPPEITILTLLAS